MDIEAEDKYYWDKYERIRAKNRGLISGSLKAGAVSIFLALILSGVNTDIAMYLGVFGLFAIFLAFSTKEQENKAKRIAEMDPNTRRGFLEEKGRNRADRIEEERRSRYR